MKKLTKIATLIMIAGGLCISHRGLTENKKIKNVQSWFAGEAMKKLHN